MSAINDRGMPHNAARWHAMLGVLRPMLWTRSGRVIGGVYAALLVLSAFLPLAAMVAAALPAVLWLFALISLLGQSSETHLRLVPGLRPRLALALFCGWLAITLVLPLLLLALQFSALKMDAHSVWYLALEIASSSLFVGWIFLAPWLALVWLLLKLAGLSLPSLPRPSLVEGATDPTLLYAAYTGALVVAAFASTTVWVSRLTRNSRSQMIRFQQVLAGQSMTAGAHVAPQAATNNRFQLAWENAWYRYLAPVPAGQPDSAAALSWVTGQPGRRVMVALAVATAGMGLVLQPAVIGLRGLTVPPAIAATILGLPALIGAVLVMMSLSTVAARRTETALWRLAAHSPPAFAVNVVVARLYLRIAAQAWLATLLANVILTVARVEPALWPQALLAAAALSPLPLAGFAFGASVRSPATVLIVSLFIGLAAAVLLAPAIGGGQALTIALVAGAVALAPLPIRLWRLRRQPPQLPVPI